jgi:hypothetical protein
VPAQLIKRLPLGVHLGSDDFLMFFECDSAFLFVVDGGPLASALSLVFRLVKVLVVSSKA